MMTVESSVVKEDDLYTPEDPRTPCIVGIGDGVSHTASGYIYGGPRIHLLANKVVCMERVDPSESLSTYTSRYQWKRSLTEVDGKRRKAAEKERSRLQLKVIDQISNPTLTFELEHFKLFGSLNKGSTEVHNTVPTLMTVDAERDCIEFEHHRKRRPHDVSYHHFYECIMEEAHKSPTPSLRGTVSSVSLRTPRSLGRTPLSNTNIATPRSNCKTPGSEALTPRFGLQNG